MIDMVNNQRLHDVILGFYHQDKLIAAECYGVACLAFARDFVLRKCIIRGKHVTGHALEYDWLDGTGVLGIDHNFHTPFYPLEHILRDATAPGGEYHGGVGMTYSMILDYPFLTGRSTQDSRNVGETMIEVLGARGTPLRVVISMTQKTGRFAIIEQFLADGFTHMFGNPGTVEQGFLDALAAYPQMKYILTLQESVAVLTADGYARATQETDPGAVAQHARCGQRHRRALPGQARPFALGRDRR